MAQKFSGSDWGNKVVKKMRNIKCLSATHSSNDELGFPGNQFQFL
jgi:hypothetical protein